MPPARNISGFRLAVAFLLGLVLLWMATAVTANFTVGTRAPSLALSLWPNGAKGAIGTASALLKTEAPASDALSHARALLRAAVMREPVNGDAVATLAAIDDFAGQTTSARKFFKVSETLTRRNVLAEVWLIEDAVRRESVGDAIVHYDRALSVSKELRPQLLPILVAAASDPEIQRDLMPKLAQRRPWWNEYFIELGTSGTSPSAIDLSARAARLDGRSTGDDIYAQAVLRRLVALKAYRQAVTLLQFIERGSSNVRGIVDGDFDASTGIAPFNWWMSDGSDVRAYFDSLPSGRSVLRIDVAQGTSGGAAQQLVGLSAGSYNVSGQVGDFNSESTSAITIAIVCAEGTTLRSFNVPRAGAVGQPFAFAFDVSAKACDAQWVNISASGESGFSAWLDALRIIRK
jgi:hypothetical protein